MPLPPKVSIILPNLNSYPFISERIETILHQTLAEWECIVIDGYSNDGSWELLTEVASKDTRFHLYQFPPKGPYDAWNKGIDKSTGEYIYIATSDDTMVSQCLEQMVSALDKHQVCDIAHCNLRVIDEQGEASSLLDWDDVPIYFDGLIQTNQSNIRYAPYDGLVHCAEGGVYMSITQLLIRKRLFEKIGLFLTNYGSIADFEWTMRASLLYHTIHIPKYLATWRIHPKQATSFASLQTIEHQRRICKLIDIAFAKALQINPNTLKGIDINKFRVGKQLGVLENDWRKAKTKRAKILVLLEWYKKNSYLVKLFIKRMIKKDYKPIHPIQYIKQQISFYHLEHNVTIVE
ncbi:glycosyltransferase [Cytophagaceae bacterium DM2B3-1]|uniref:Glycosyltransferase n=1 Tax=Xanthocytophaga flava TaxID=3048013 RepID=A0ABT7CG68_9BACT|nr:glycosyltransferase [Xanthocytophaga flavus]MDJ1491709.1 glycosyltransferase [Xanthocytophaga flavus]